MIRCSALQQRPREFGSECADFTYFDEAKTLFAKLQYEHWTDSGPEAFMNAIRAHGRMLERFVLFRGGIVEVKVAPLALEAAP